MISMSDVINTPMPGWENHFPNTNVVVPLALVMHWAWRLENMSCVDFCGGDGKCYERGHCCTYDLHWRTFENVLGYRLYKNAT